MEKVPEARRFRDEENLFGRVFWLGLRCRRYLRVAHAVRPQLAYLPICRGWKKSRRRDASGTKKIYSGEFFGWGCGVGVISAWRTRFVRSSLIFRSVEDGKSPGGATLPGRRKFIRASFLAGAAVSALSPRGARGSSAARLSSDL